MWPRKCAVFCRNTKTCRISSPFWVWTNCPTKTKNTVNRARKIQRFLSQPFAVGEQFTGRPGKYVKLADTIKSFKGIVNGEYDHIPESCFFMCGGIEDVLANYEKIKDNE